MESGMRFVERQDWKNWFKVFLGLIIAYQAVMLLLTVILILQSGVIESFGWPNLLLSILQPAAIITGAVLTWIKVKWGFYLLIGAESLGILTALISVFAAGMNFFSALGAMIAGGLIPALLVIFVCTGMASTTGSNLFKRAY